MTTNIQLAKEIAKFVQLRSIVLKNAHLESSIEGNLPPTISINQQHRCLFEEKTDEERFINVLAEFKFNASKEEGDAIGSLAKLEATFLLVYAIPQEAKFDHRCLKHFAELNGIYNAWPYWRELVQTVTGRIGLGGILVPVFRPVATELADEEDAGKS